MRSFTRRPPPGPGPRSAINSPPGNSDPQGSPPAFSSHQRHGSPLRGNRSKSIARPASLAAIGHLPFTCRRLSLPCPWLFVAILPCPWPFVAPASRRLLVFCAAVSFAFRRHPAVSLASRCDPPCPLPFVVILRSEATRDLLLVLAVAFPGVPSLRF